MVHMEQKLDQCIFIKFSHWDYSDGGSVFYSSTFLEPFRGPRNSIFKLSFETQSLEIALVE